jgi:hypothetical protein
MIRLRENKIGNRLWAVLLLLAMPCLIFAQEKFYLKAATTAVVGQNYKVSYILENASGSNFTAPRYFEGFQVLSGPNQSSSFQWINGKTTQSIEYYYILRPVEEGEFELPAGKIQVKGKILETETIRVNVKQGHQPTQAQQPTQTQKTQPQSTGGGDWRQVAKDNLFVRLYVDKNNPFEGEQITLTAKIYQRIQSYNTQIIEFPDFKGFWKQDYDASGNQWQDEEYQGQYYKTLVIGKYALFPQREGAFTISPFKLRTILRVQDDAAQTGSPWDWFFRPQYKEVEYEFSTSSVTVNVKPLPSAGRPANFSGAVGNFTLEASLDSSELKVGNATTLKTKISGTGNIMLMQKPRIDFPRELEVYDPQVQENISKTANPISGSYKADYLIVAAEPGNFIIPPVEFSFFDLKSQSYKTITSSSFELHVKGDKPVATTPVLGKETVEYLDTDIRFIALKNDLKKQTTPLLESAMFYSLMAGAPLFLFLLLFVRKKLEENRPDLMQKRNKMAGKVAQKRLKTARNFLEKQDRKGFYNELVKAMWGYVADKLSINTAHLTKQNVTDKLAYRNVSEEKSQRLIQLIEKCEMALYSPVSGEEMMSDFETAGQIITEIENELA